MASAGTREMVAAVLDPRARPITPLMTAVATSSALTPTALGMGKSGFLYTPLAIVAMAAEVRLRK